MRRVLDRRASNQGSDAQQALLPQVVSSGRPFVSPFQHSAPAELWPVYQSLWTKQRTEEKFRVLSTAAFATIQTLLQVR